jgi:predicted Rdx family selenoprotein
MSHMPVTGRRTHRQYNWCPRCRELWAAAWMAQKGLSACPSCEGHVLGYVARTPYDDPAAESRPQNAGFA